MNNNYEYGRLDGFLSVIYWLSIVGGGLLILIGALAVLGAVPFLLVGGIMYVVGILVDAAALIGGGVLYFMAAKQLKEVNPQFFDTYVLTMLLIAGGSVLSSVFLTLSWWGTGNLISTIIWQAISLVVSFCLSVMYLSKSERVRVFFGDRPLPQSKYWSIIQQLPTFLTDATPVNFSGQNNADTTETVNPNYVVPTAQPAPQEPVQGTPFPTAEEPQAPEEPQE